MLLTDSERDAILAGLRLLQRAMKDGTLDADIRAILADSGAPLTCNRIDYLCEQINQ